MTPSSGWTTPHGLIESVEFTAQKNLLDIDPKELDHATWALTWAMSTEPEHFDEVAWGVRIAVTRPFGSLPALLILFRTDIERWECEMLWLEHL